MPVTEPADTTPRRPRDVPPPVVAPYEFRHLVEYTGVDKDRARHWLDVGIIVPAIAADGHGTRRFFRLRELVLLRVVDWLHRFGIGEAEMRYIASMVDNVWEGFTVAALKESGRTILWIRFSAKAALRYDARLLATTRRAAPQVSLATLAEVATEGLHGSAGIFINLAPIIRDLEKATGETLT
jgi:DNA-binding transcriptional MerR regulator